MQGTTTYYCHEAKLAQFVSSFDLEIHLAMQIR